MKLQKVIVALGLSACLAVPQMPATLAATPATQSHASAEKLSDSDELAATISESKDDNNSDSKETSKTEDSSETKDSSDEKNAEKTEDTSADQKDSSEGTDSQNTSDETDSSNPSESQGKEDSSMENGSQTETISQEDTTSPSGTSSKTSSTSTTNKKSSGKSTKKSKTKAEKEAAEKAKKKAKKKAEEEKKALSKLQNLASYTPSSTFIDDSEKVKYSTDVPIDNLPEFITQEMIVGALKCQDETGYPASVTIAQIIQESGYGKYGPGGDDGKGLSYLAFQYNNLFGIKGTGTAGSVVMKTGEQRSDGSTYSTSAYFRAYNTYTECIEDRTELLQRRYSDLLDDVTDANTFAMRIGSRWATSLTYGQNLIKQMETYDLYRLDDMTLDDFDELLGNFVNPCPGASLSSSFGFRNAPTAGASTYHQGIDLATGGSYLPTYAAESGTVIYAGSSGASGNLIVIDHGNGLVTKYGHHSKIYVKVGDKVEKGQQIGLTGSTGVSTGIHLHFQVEVNGQAVNPLTWLNEQE